MWSCGWSEPFRYTLMIKTVNINFVLTFICYYLTVTFSSRCYGTYITNLIHFVQMFHMIWQNIWYVMVGEHWMIPVESGSECVLTFTTTIPLFNNCPFSIMDIGLHAGIGFRSHVSLYGIVFGQWSYHKLLCAAWSLVVVLPHSFSFYLYIFHLFRLSSTVATLTVAG